MVRSTTPCPSHHFLSKCMSFMQANLASYLNTLVPFLCYQLLPHILYLFFHNVSMCRRFVPLHFKVLRLKGTVAQIQHYPGPLLLYFSHYTYVQHFLINLFYVGNFEHMPLLIVWLCFNAVLYVHCYSHFTLLTL